MLRKPENNFLRAIYAGVQNFFSGPIAGLTNQPPVQDFQPSAPLESAAHKIEHKHSISGGGSGGGGGNLGSHHPQN